MTLTTDEEGLTLLRGRGNRGPEGLQEGRGALGLAEGPRLLEVPRPLETHRAPEFRHNAGAPTSASLEPSCRGFDECPVSCCSRLGKAAQIIDGRCSTGCVMQPVCCPGLSWRKYLPSYNLQEDPDIRSDSYITNGFAQWSRGAGVWGWFGSTARILNRVEDINTHGNNHPEPSRGSEPHKR